MWTRTTLIVCGLSLSVVACGSDPENPDKGSGGSAGTASPTAGTAASGAGTGGTSAGGAGGGGSAGAATGDCALQGSFSASAELKIQDNKCNTLGDFKTTYNVTIAKSEITIEQFVEKVPMKGSIDGACKAAIVVNTPAYREFQLNFAPAGLTAMGTYIAGDTSDCRSTYDASLKLTAK